MFYKTLWYFILNILKSDFNNKNYNENNKANKGDLSSASFKI